MAVNDSIAGMSSASIQHKRTSSSAASKAPTSLPASATGAGHLLDWREVLQQLQADKQISPDAARHAYERCSNMSARMHAIERLAQAKMQHAQTGRVLDMEWVTEWLARQASVPYLRIDPLKVEITRIGELMSAGFAERYRILPINVTQDEVTVATAEPFDRSWVPELERMWRKRITRVVSNPQDIQRYTNEFFNLARSVKTAVKSGGALAGSQFEQLVELSRTGKTLDANDAGVVQVVDWLWQYAFEQRASDIHLEPRRDQGVVRFRIDGVLHPVYQVPPSVMNAITSRVKLLGRMDVVEKRRPQDGRIKTKRPDGNEVEMRLSTLPTAFGEKLVMRIFDPEVVVKDLAALGFNEHDAKRWESLITRPYGIILVTGPTGSGKTTTLYSTLKRLATDEVNVCTVEDPIEMIEPSLNQMQVQHGIDLGFADGLRALMRQDPDIIMVGEIRDLETAEMAVQAALTGHLVFSTLHTNDAPSAITRLLELGVPYYLLNATVLGVLAQRLVRTLCTHCKAPHDNFDKAAFEEAVKPWSVHGTQRPYKAVGCLECRMTGYQGRLGVYELLTLTDALRELVTKEPDIGKLRAQGIKDGMHPLRVAGAMKVAEGATTMEEVLANTPLIHS
jgi:general secretion pathway protein E